MKKIIVTLTEVAAVFAIIGLGIVALIAPINAEEYATDTYTDDMYLDSIKTRDDIRQVGEGVVLDPAVQAIYNTYENTYEETVPNEPTTTYYMHKCDGANAIVEYYNGQPTQYAAVSEDYTETYDYQSFTWAEGTLDDGTEFCLAIND